MSKALNVMLWILVAAGVYEALVSYLDRPEVQWSHSHDRCVRVIDYKAKSEGTVPRWSCNNLPPRYERVMVR